MEFVAADLDLRKCLIGDFDAGLVGFGIQLGMNLETGRSSGRGDETDDCLQNCAEVCRASFG